MTPDLAPLEARLAGALLRHHRETSRLLLEDSAAVLGCDRSKISRIETGHRRVVPGEILSLLEAYGVTAREREAVSALARSARSGWWGEYQGLLPGALVDRAVLETAAGDVMAYDPQAVPAFLQTAGYAKAVTGADPALRTEEERRLAVLLCAGRAACLRARPAAACTVVLGEAALAQQVGGSAVMLAQLRRLADEDGEPRVPVTLRVISFAAGAHPGTGAGPFSVIRFRGVSGVGAVCQGWSDSGVSVVRQAELTAAVRRFDAIRDAALSHEASLRVIRAMIRDWR